MHKTLLLYIIIIGFLTSCSPSVPDNVQAELDKMSKSNQKKFEQVFKHFKGHKNKQKLKASFYIVENINDFGFYIGEQLKEYDALFDVLASKPDDFNDKLPWYSKEVDKIIDSLELVYGKLDPNLMYYKKDVDVFTVKSFIKYINDAFEAWQNPWSQHLTFDEFCEYILPYRLGGEPLENWRKMFIQHYSHVLDSLPPNATMADVGNLLNKDAELRYATGLGRYMTPISPSNMIKGRFGSCADMSTYKALVMRSFGIPVCTDFFPQWGNDHNNHYWNGMMNENGEIVSMDSAIDDRNSWVAYKYQIAKVYRKTFSKQAEMLKLKEYNQENIPNLFQDSRIIDVTNKYIPVSNYSLPTNSIPPDVPLAYLCVFNDHGFTPIAYAHIKNNIAEFKDMGRQVLYFPMYIKDSKFHSAGTAFIFEENGEINYKNVSDKTENMILTRKYHLYSRKVDWLRCLVNGKFQGANKSDFSDSVTLATITRIPSQHFENISVNNSKSYKYYRFLFDPSELELEYDDAGASISEIEFIDNYGRIMKGNPIGTDPKNYSEYKPDKCFDGNVLTFFEDPRKDAYEKWVGLELDKPARLSKIRYSSRNDLNNVQKGDLYELLMWNNQNFESLGQQVAKDTMLFYENCPTNAVFWLRNLSGGKEERVFTYENKKQVWW